MDVTDLTINEIFGDRDKRLVLNCVAYSENDPAGLPGHNLMLIVAEFYKYLEHIRNMVGDERYEAIVLKYRYGDELKDSFDPPVAEWWNENTSDS